MWESSDSIDSGSFTKYESDGRYTERAPDVFQKVAVDILTSPVPDDQKSNLDGYDPSGKSVFYGGFTSLSDVDQKYCFPFGENVKAFILTRALGYVLHLIQRFPRFCSLLNHCEGHPATRRRVFCGKTKSKL